MRELELFFDFVSVEVVLARARETMGGDFALGYPSGDGVLRDVEEIHEVDGIEQELV